MTLSEINIGESAIVKAVNCNSSLRNRFYSFGIVKGSTIKVEEITLAKSTMEIKINTSKIAVRISEAQTIEVERC